jgi:hypothetical protein
MAPLLLQNASGVSLTAVQAVPSTQTTTTTTTRTTTVTNMKSPSLVPRPKTRLAAYPE